MKLGGSLAHSQTPTTCSYSEAVGPCHNGKVRSQVVDGIVASRYRV